MNNFFIILSILALFFLLGFILLSIFACSLITIEKIKKDIFSREKGAFQIVFCLKHFTKNRFEDLYLTTSLTKCINLILFTSITAILLYRLQINLALSILVILITLMFINVLSKAFGKILSKKILYISSIFSSIYIYLFYPLNQFFLWLYKKSIKKSQTTEKLVNFIYDINISKIIDPKLLSSLITFKDKVAREVMIPRVKVFSISDTTTLKEASSFLVSKGYSRIPVYKDKIDNVVGVLMFKDLLNIIIENVGNQEEILQKSVDFLIKPLIYVPENKKISKLFQEFKSQKRHMAIVVNEYGGTEGIITIEDILEELVGEIQDEYDIDEEKKLWRLPDGNHIVDAKLSIIDLEKELNITLPHNPEYETIGGFIFHNAGEIPSKGWVLHLDNFEFEVLSSTDRSVDKIKISKKDEELK